VRHSNRTSSSAKPKEETRGDWFKKFYFYIAYLVCIAVVCVVSVHNVLEKAGHSAFDGRGKAKGPLGR